MSSRPEQGVITHNVTAMRATPNADSELVSQAILGDTAGWLEEQEEWVRIRTADAYEGWVWRRHLAPWIGVGRSTSGVGSDPQLPTTDALATAWPFDEQPENACWVARSIADLYREPTNELEAKITRLPVGAVLRLIKENYGGGYALVQFPYGPGEPDGPVLMTGYIETGDLMGRLERASLISDIDGYSLCLNAKRFLGTPYLWGGATPFGFDCSGFVQRVYSIFGVTLPRDAYLQARSPLGRMLEPDEVRQPGDLVFFCGPHDPRGRGITHVGMALDAARFIHSVGKEGVIETDFDDPYYSSYYTDRGAWRLNSDS